jgi:hypothetical protein
MKKFIFLLLFSIQLVFCQENLKSANDSIFLMSMAEKLPEYIGGNDEFIKCISTNIELPKTTEFKGGKIISTFVVNIDGSIEDVKILRDAGFETGIEVKRLLLLCNKWNAGEINGNKVRILYTLPITFPAYEPEVIENIEPDDKGEVFQATQIDVIPQFPGGIEEFYKFIGKNFRISGDERLSGKILIRFIVEKDGSVNHITILKDVGFGSGDEAIRVIKLMPKWIPAKKDGNNVRCIYQLPIKIN